MRLVRYLLYISTVRLMGSGTISIHTERLQISDSPGKLKSFLSR